jgi:guanylate kinase
VQTQEIERRLEAARREIENYPNYDYILVNDRLEESLDEMVAIVQAERAKRSGKTLSPEDKHYLAASEKCLKPKMEGKIRDILASFEVPPSLATKR